MPAAARLPTTVQSCRAILCARRCVPAVVGVPFTSNRSFAAYGMPCRIPRPAPLFIALSAARACACARSGMMRINDRSRSSSAAIRPRSSSVYFTGLRRPLPMRADKLAIDSNAASVSDMVILAKWDCTVPRDPGMAQIGIPASRARGQDPTRNDAPPLLFRAGVTICEDTIAPPRNPP